MDYPVDQLEEAKKLMTLEESLNLNLFDIISKTGLILSGDIILLELDMWARGIEQTCADIMQTDHNDGSSNPAVD